MKQYDVVVIGAGPAGIFTALELAKIDSTMKVLIVDKGREIKKRSCPMRKTERCVNCNPCAIVNGWSGAGAFSDGKLSLGTEVGGNVVDYLGEQKTAELIHYADTIYLKFGAQEKVYGNDEKKVDEICYEASKYNIKLVPCPVRHLGTEKAFDVLGGMYDYLMASTKTEFLELTTVETIISVDNTVTGVILKNKMGEFEEIQAKHVVAAPGRGGSQWLTDQAKKMG
ncbi:MAG: FAD-binding protein, partial [Hyphomonadaceae bacterium]|nr:FAD-binding protein [Clostridia bacterium]